MDYELSADERLLRQSLRSLLDAIMPFEQIRATEQLSEIRAEAWKRLVAGDWLAVSDADAGPLDLIYAAEEIGAHLFPGPFSLTVALLLPLLREVDAIAADDVQAGQALATIVLPALEPRDPSVWRWRDVTLRRVNGGLRLAGRAWAVPFASVSQLLVVPVESDGDGGDMSIVILPLPIDDVAVEPCPGVDLTRPAAHLIFDDALVPEAAVHTGQLRPLLERGLALYLLALNAEAVGAAERVLAATVAYVTNRQQFGVPVGSFQAVKHMLADSSVDVELARTRTYHVGWETGLAPVPDLAAVGSARLLAARAYRRVCERAIQCHGGIAFTEEQGLHLWYRSALAAEAHLAHPIDLRRFLFSWLADRVSRKTLPTASA